MLNPNLAAAWFLERVPTEFGVANMTMPIERFARAMRLSPLDPEMFRMQTGTAMAHMFAGRFECVCHGRKKHSESCRASCS